MKRIVLCSDGTGNTANKGRGTNVFKLYEAIDRSSEDCDQVAFYDDGVGTQRWKWVKLFSGATGYGLSRNVRHLYAQLCRVYEKGDHIYVFGFSRGAFTVRTLVGLIDCCGVIGKSEWSTDSELSREVRRCYRQYRKNYNTMMRNRVRWALDHTLKRAATSPPTQAPPSPRQESSPDTTQASSPSPEIEFVGVWDTVDAVGLPVAFLAEIVNALVYRFKFPNNRLSSIVKRGCQALAIDDERRTFWPELWDTDEQISQVWFPGVHSDVGGGYPRQEVSLTALDWMMQQASERGLRFSPAVKNRILEAKDALGLVHDPRIGLGAYYRYSPRCIAELHKKSLSGAPKLSRRLTKLYQTLGSSDTAKPKGELGPDSREAGVNPLEGYEQLPAIHVSALDRIGSRTDGYAPGNLPACCRVEGIDDATSEAISRALAQFHAKTYELQPGELSNTLLCFSAGRVLLRQTLQTLFLGSALMTAVTLLFSEHSTGLPGWGEPLRRAAGWVLPELLVDTWLPRFLNSPWVAATLVLGVLSYVIGRQARRSLQSSYSEFWTGFVREHEALFQAVRSVKGRRGSP